MLVLAVALMAGSLHAQDAHAQDITGTWQGMLPSGKRIIIKIAKDGGGFKGTLYSIDSMGGQPVPTEAITLQGSAVKIPISGIDGVCEGKLSADGTALNGTMTFGDSKPKPFNMAHVTEATAWEIPAFEPPKKMPADADPSFDVVTIKPSDPTKMGKNFGFRGRHFTTFHTNVNDLIAFAYGLHAKQIVNAPPWLGTEMYDIDGVPDVEGRPNDKQSAIMMQKLLVDRFQLKFHHEKRELAVYTITIARGGPKLIKTTSAPNDDTAFWYRNLGQLTVKNMTIADFAEWMQASAMDRPVVDRTGLTDRYDFKLNWTPDESQFAQFRSGGMAPPPAKDDPNAPPGLYTAIQEQLGLKMDAVKASADVIVIDQVERPSAN